MCQPKSILVCRTCSQVLLKPDLVGPDGTETSFFGPGNRFFGSSAAAPNVAAVGALMLQQDPSLKVQSHCASLCCMYSGLLNAKCLKLGSPVNAVVYAQLASKVGMCPFSKHVLLQACLGFKARNKSARCRAATLEHTPFYACLA